MASVNARKVVSALDVVKTAARVKNRVIINDMIYYLRKLLNLAKDSQKLSLYESNDLLNDFNLDFIEEEINRLEDESKKLFL